MLLIKIIEYNNIVTYLRIKNVSSMSIKELIALKKYVFQIGGLI